jgi:hypothetical protein
MKNTTDKTIETNAAGEPDLECECGATAHRDKSHAVVEVAPYSIAQWPCSDKTDPLHFIFDEITKKRDTRGSTWTDFNGGAQPLCAECYEKSERDGLFKSHDLATCSYEDCVDVRAAIAKEMA